MKVSINPEQQEAQDIFKAGTLVEIKKSDSGSWLVLVSDCKQCKDYFSGTIIHASLKPKRIGEHCTSWLKSEFDRFVGNVTLEQ